MPTAPLLTSPGADRPDAPVVVNAYEGRNKEKPREVRGWHVKMFQTAKAMKEPSIVFCLIEKLLDVLKESGATEEQSLAALKATEAIVPVADFSSRKRTTLHLRA